MIRSMKIKQKLISAFLLIGLFSTLVVSLGLFTIHKSNSITMHSYNEHLLPTSYLYTVQKNMLYINSNYLLILYEKDILQSEKRMKEIRQWTKENQELLIQYENSSPDRNQLDTYTQFKKDLDSYQNISSQLSNLLLQNDFSNAMNVAPSFHSKTKIINKDIQVLINDNQQAAEAAMAETRSFYMTATVILIGLAALCLVLALILGLLFSKMFCVPIIKLTAAADKLAEGNIEVDLDHKGEKESSVQKDEIAELLCSFRKMAANIKRQAQAAEDIASGNLSLEIVPQSEKDVLTRSMISMKETLQDLVEESNTMTLAAIEGDLENRGDELRFQGSYREIIAGFNRTLDALTEPLDVSAKYIERISKGDIPHRITEKYNGHFNIIIENLNQCIDAVNALIEDIQMLSDGTLQGNLKIRADAKRHGGDFGRIIEGMNSTLDAVTVPLLMAGEYMDQIGRGEIPEEITETCYGDFDRIKGSINACILGLGALREGSGVLERMSNNDFSARVTGEYLGIYQEIAESVNEVAESIDSVIKIVNHVSVGSFSDLEVLKESGKKSEKDELIPSLIMMIETIRSLVKETDLLSEAAVEGNLSVRGQEAGFLGEYARVIQGINKTLDAVNAPVEEALKVLQEMAMGNLQMEMEGDYQGGHGELKKAINDTTGKLRSYIKEISEVLNEMGGGNLNLTITADYSGDFVAIKNSLNHIIITMSRILGNINNAAYQVASGAKQVSDGSQSLSQGSVEQSGSIEELNASISEVSSQTKQNAKNAGEASLLTSLVREHADTGNQQMKEMLSAMEGISQSSASISKIIKVIDDIAFQTNILALNAAVEAARAGRHGKGFAVVADEVRSLAKRSADAAKNTWELIDESMKKVQDGAKTADKTALALQEIVNGVETAADLVSDIAQSSKEQASAIALISKGIEQVSHVVQNNSATAEESAAASEELSGQSEMLKEMVSGFRLYEGQPLLPDTEPQSDTESEAEVLLLEDGLSRDYFWNENSPWDDEKMKNIS
jgi:methyl-accepting chemotaxis protein